MYCRRKVPCGMAEVFVHPAGTPRSNWNWFPPMRTKLGFRMFPKRLDSFMFIRTTRLAAMRSSYRDVSSTNWCCSGWMYGKSDRVPKRPRSSSHSSHSTREAIIFMFCGSVRRRTRLHSASTREVRSSNMPRSCRHCMEVRKMRSATPRSACALAFEAKGACERCTIMPSHLSAGSARASFGRRQVTKSRRSVSWLGRRQSVRDRRLWFR
mmetsp:Transcript_6658/g.15673  ORF Transcript_6658/g.15673 Transcript_6658/m.15673 type:complete len:210 (+) Transcript_6658:735-1364(+)